MASKMLHTCLRVENLEKSIAFYQDAFGFKELRRRDFPDHAFTIVYLGLEGDDYELELTYNYDHGPYVVGDGFDADIVNYADSDKSAFKRFLYSLPGFKKLKKTLNSVLTLLVIVKSVTVVSMFL